MKNLCYRVVAMVISLSFTGTMTNASRKSSISLSSECQWDGYLLTHCSFTGKLDLPEDTSQTATTVDLSSNFFKVVLEPHMRGKWNMKHLDLSYNCILKITFSSLTHFHGLESLNLSKNAIYTILSDLPSPKSSRRKYHRRSLRNGLPFLKLLTLKRNKLSDIPKGSRKLKPLDLTFNGMSQIGLSDFPDCLHLESLHLKSNNQFGSHPEDFKSLKQLQVLGLSGALTTVLTLVTAAQAPLHLQANPAGTQGPRDCHAAVFQKFTSESWRLTWDIICNKPLRSQETYWWTPKRRISRETHLPRAHQNHEDNPSKSEAEQPREEVRAGFPTVGEEDHASPGAREKQSGLPRRVRSAGDVPPSGRKEAAQSQDLTLAVCLAVFITFFVAFCLGAFTRPFIDRLWQRIRQDKRPHPVNAYSNEGFCDEVEAAGNIQQHPMVDVRQGLPDLNLLESQNPFPRREASPGTAGLAADTALGTRGKESGSWQSRAGYGAKAGAWRPSPGQFPDDSTAPAGLGTHANTGSNALISATPDCIYRKHVLEEVQSDTVSREDFLSVQSLSVPESLQTVCGSVHNTLNELEPTHSRDKTDSLSPTLVQTEAQNTGKAQTSCGTKNLSLNLSKEKQVSTNINLLHEKQQRPKDGAEVPCSMVILHGQGDTDPLPLGCPPGWKSETQVTPANREPGQKHATSDTQYELDTNYDSDEGSLFTLSSENSEDARNWTEEEAFDEDGCRARGPPENKDLGMRKSSVRSLENSEGITSQKVLGAGETQEDHFEKPLTHSGMIKTQVESNSNTNKFEDPLIVPRSQSNSPFSDESPGMSTPHPQPVEWQYDLRDLPFSNVDISPQTPPPRSAKVPSDSKSDCSEIDSVHECETSTRD
ncbi:PREDICTED: leucine-rich repeat-containing protein 66 [Condylura cristata]|uniref:leucine-rich repeat-containing protein 66 n=1 Tax=Condylura cristata TaxID=143302 RepID=UPI000643C1A4|nr:PREDICTED: leucine-rich repeat-containing protein 66 [Condylura cristata]